MVIFYSWQSDLPNKTNWGFIEKALQKAIKKLKKESSILADYDRDTKGVPGSPDISDEIFKKIAKSDVFLADVTPINRNFLGRIANKRAMPNPNVLVELGFAARRLGWDKVILVLNSSYATIEQLPFDFRARRVISYSTKNDNGMEVFSSVLSSRLAQIAEDPNVKTDLWIDAEIAHDREIYLKMDALIPEIQLFSILETLDTYRFYFYSKTRTLFYDYPFFCHQLANHFLDEDLQTSSTNLLSVFEQFHSFIAGNFFAADAPNDDRADINFYKDHDWQPHPEFERLSKRLFEHTDKVREAYIAFRMLIKTKLLL